MHNLEKFHELIGLIGTARPYGLIIALLIPLGALLLAEGLFITFGQCAVGVIQ